MGNTVGALVCAFLLERIIQFRPSLERVKDVAGYVLLACFFGTTVNALFNVASLCYGGQIPWDDMFSHVLQWWVPNALAALVVAPLILVWGSPSDIRWSPALIIKGIFCALGLLGGTLVSLSSW